MKDICGYFNNDFEHLIWKLFVVICSTILRTSYESYLWLFEGWYWALEMKAICGYWKKDIEHWRWKLFVVIGRKILSTRDECYSWQHYIGACYTVIDTKIKLDLSFLPVASLPAHNNIELYLPSIFNFSNYIRKMIK